MALDDELMFIDDEPPELAGTPWRVLIVDDDPDVHAATQLALLGFIHHGRALSLSSAHSGSQAMALIQATEVSFDLVLLDVVMDTPTDGLDTARSIREFLECMSIPYIIIRTGQPAYAAEADVLRMPQINAYLAKGKTTAMELLTEVRKGLDSVAGHQTCGA